MMLDQIVERVGGSFLRLYDYFGGTTSPARPGELSASGRRSIGMFDAAFGQRRRGVGAGSMYPELERHQLVELLNEMDHTGMASSILDMQTADAVEPDQDTDRAITLDAPGSLRKEIMDLLGRVGAEQNLGRWTRSMVKYGDDFRRLQYSPARGVMGLIYADPIGIEMVHDSETRDLKGYKDNGRKFRGEGNSDISWPWDYVTFSMQSKDEVDFYGTGILTPAIRSWTQLVLAEDAALLYRISRQPDRLKFKIDTGTASVEEMHEQLEEWRKAVNHQEFVDPVSSKMRREFNPVSVLQNIFMPVRSNSISDIDLMPGSSNTQDVGDLSYYARKFLHDTGTPPELYGYPLEDGSREPFARNKAVQNQDVRYARRVKQIQRSICAGIHRIIMIHLTLRYSQFGAVLNRISPVDDIRVKLQPPSFLAELERLEVIQLRLSIAAEMTNLLNASNGVLKSYEYMQYILREILQMEDRDIFRLTAKPKVNNPDAPALPSPGGRPKRLPKKSSKARRDNDVIKPTDPESLVKDGIDPSSAEFGMLTDGDLSLLGLADGSLNEAEIASLRQAIDNSPRLQRSIAVLATLSE